MPLCQEGLAFAGIVFTHVHPRRWTYIGLMLVNADGGPALRQHRSNVSCLLGCYMLNTLNRCWFDVGPTLKQHLFNISCLAGCMIYMEYNYDYMRFRRAEDTRTSIPSFNDQGMINSISHVNSIYDKRKSELHDQWRLPIVYMVLEE